MPWWLSIALDWFPAVLVALLVAWWLDLPPVSGATLLVFLMVVGTTKLVHRLVRLAQSRAAPAAKPAPESKAP